MTSTTKKTIESLQNQTPPPATTVPKAASAPLGKAVSVQAAPAKGQQKGAPLKVPSATEAVKPAASASAKAKTSVATKAVVKTKPGKVVKAGDQSAAKATAKTQPKPVAKVSAKAVAGGVASAVSKAAPKPEKASRPKKSKLVRDSFTIPKAEYLVLDELKLRAVKLNTAIKKGELLRAGIKALAAMSDGVFLMALKAVPAIKTGRPAKLDGELPG